MPLPILTPNIFDARGENLGFAVDEKIWINQGRSTQWFAPDTLNNQLDGYNTGNRKYNFFSGSRSKYPFNTNGLPKIVAGVYCAIGSDAYPSEFGARKITTNAELSISGSYSTDPAGDPTKQIDKWTAVSGGYTYRLNNVPSAGPAYLTLTGNKTNSNIYLEWDDRLVSKIGSSAFLNDGFLARGGASTFDTIRPMSSQGDVNGLSMKADGSYILTSADLPYYQSATAGIGLDGMCGAANDLDANLWHCMPVYADDSYIAAVITYLYTHVNRGILLEAYNEPFNTVFRFSRAWSIMTAWNRNLANVRGDGSSTITNDYTFYNDNGNTFYSTTDAPIGEFNSGPTSGNRDVAAAYRATKAYNAGDKVWMDIQNLDGTGTSGWKLMRVKAGQSVAVGDTPFDSTKWEVFGYPDNEFSSRIFQAWYTNKISAIAQSICGSDFGTKVKIVFCGQLEYSNGTAIRDQFIGKLSSFSVYENIHAFGFSNYMSLYDQDKDWNTAPSNLKDFSIGDNAWAQNYDALLRATMDQVAANQNDGYGQTRNWILSQPGQSGRSIYYCSYEGGLNHGAFTGSWPTTGISNLLTAYEYWRLNYRKETDAYWNCLVHNNIPGYMNDFCFTGGYGGPFAEGWGAQSATYITEHPKLDGLQQYQTAAIASGRKKFTEGNTPTPIAPTPLTAPILVGSGTVGATLTVTPSTYSGTVTSFVRVWKRGASVIAGVTGTTYVTQIGDAGQSITVMETASNSSASAAPQTSNAITVATIPPVDNPVALTKPTILNGGKNLNVGQTVQGVAGTYDRPVTLAWKWQRNGVDIPNTNSLQYLVTDLDMGLTLTLDEIAIG